MSTLKTMYPAQTNSPFTKLLGEISTTDTRLVVEDASVLPQTVPYLLTLGYDKSASETVLVTAADGNTLTVTRGIDGNVLLWVVGTKCARVFTAKDLNDVQDNIRTLNTGKSETTHTHTGYQNKITAQGILKGSGGGNVSAATAGTDYQTPLTAGEDYQTPLEADVDYQTPLTAGVDYQTPLTAGVDYATPSAIPAATTTTPKANGTAAVGTETKWAKGDHVHPTDTTRQVKITASGILKGDGAGGVSKATAGSDYQAAITATGILKGNGSGGVSAAAAGTDYVGVGDSRLSDARTPTAHKATHKTGGTDAITPADIGAAASDHSHTKSDIGLGNVANERQYSANNPPPYPVTSVNGSTGAVTIESPPPSTTVPSMDGTASTGSENAWAHGDHVHPTDTGRQARIDVTGVLQGNGGGSITTRSVTSSASSGSSYLITSGGVYTAVSNKQTKMSTASYSGAISRTLSDNYDYTFSAVTSLTLTGGNIECHGFITFSSDTTHAITLSGFNGISGDDIESAGAGEVWEFSCCRGYIIFKNWSE